ncbi:MAG: hypothetical protein JW850_02655 [Thermoflexales bacterium]|nr:hypothetical protein [Thermoflexales bacterium]
MLDVEHHWFYGTQPLSAHALAEKLQQEFWRQHAGDTHVCSTQAQEWPYRFRLYRQAHSFDLELDPAKALVCRSKAGPSSEDELGRVAEILSRSMHMAPSFRYQDGEGGAVLEWWTQGREARWQAMQGQPAFENLQRIANSK